MTDDEEKVRAVVSEVLVGLDETVLEYLVSLISEEQADSEQALADLVVPFLLSSGFLEEEEESEAQRLVAQIYQKVSVSVDAVHSYCEDITRLDKAQSMADSSHSQSDVELMELMWGFDKIRKQKNDTLDACASSQSQRQIRKQIKIDKWDKQREEQEAALDRAWEDTRFLPDPTADTGERDIHVPRLTINFKGATLLSDTSLKLINGRRYGLIGKNGAGKTTLLRYISHYEIEGFPRHVRIQHVEQESASKLSTENKTVLQVVLDCDYERKILLDEEKELNESGDTDNPRLKDIYDRLGEIDADKAESRARTILSGLQFDPKVIDGPASALSGGWRMRTALAGALFMSPDLLLLDEPTNHLDLEAVMWLETYLETYEKTLIVVSHDRNFLNTIVTDVIFFHNQKLQYFKGDYDSFEKTRKEFLKQQRKAYDAQQMKISHMQEFIDRFRCNAKKAPLVQSRIKALNKIELLDEPEDAQAFKMSFPPPEPLGRPIISISDVKFGYSPDKILFEDVNFGIDMSSRIGILGVNGCGKSTLINIMLGKLRPLAGDVVMNPRLRVSTFTQHHIDQLELGKSAVENMMRLFPGHEPPEFRNHLGRFNVSGQLAIKPTRTLSGGQKSRVGFAMLTWKLPHVVVMDEPTNHLDLETIDALIGAINDYKGGVLVVSHDQHFVQSVCNEIWVVEGGRCTLFRGSMDDYKKKILK